MQSYDSICCFRNRHNDGYRILLEITDCCNQHCIFCHAKDRKTMSIASISKIINNLRDIKIHDVILTGGEPLLHRNIFEILEWFKTKHIDCDLCSNGTLIDEQKAKTLANYLSEISISLDTVNPEVYDYLRGTKNGLEKAISGIIHCKNSGLEVHLTTVLTKSNFSEIEEIINKAEELGVHSISFLAVIVDVAKDKVETEKIALSDFEKEKVMEIINRHRNQGMIINTKRICACNEEYCRAGQNILGITSEGKVLGCIMHRDKSFDINEQLLTKEMLIELQKNNTKC